MEIASFEEFINATVPKDEPEEGGNFKYELEMWLCADGCLSAKYDGRFIQSEGVPWPEALDKIAAAIRDVEAARAEDK